MKEEEGGSLATVTNIASQSVVRVTPSSVDLKPSPIQPEWILGGSPQAWKKEVARSRDRMSQIIVWECSAGLFMWHYNKDESLIVISGEALVTMENGQELRLGPGDAAFFPAGTTCTWRVPGPLRKVAVMREPMWRTLGYAVKAWNRVLRIVGLTGRPSLTPADRTTFVEPPRKVS
jgi:uncharacterized protein